MRPAFLLSLLLALLAGPALAQPRVPSLDAQFPSGFQSGFGSQFQAEIRSGFSGDVTTTIRNRIGPEYPTTGTYLDFEGCAPQHANLNHTGCQPVEWFGPNQLGTYDRSIEAMSPLRGVTLDLGRGPFMQQ